MSHPKITRRSFVNALPLTVLATPSVLSAVESGARMGAGTTCPSLRSGADATGSDGVACGSCGTFPRAPEGGAQEVDRHGFAGPFTEEEEAAVAASPMAGVIAGLHGEGYSCSEMILLAALRTNGLQESHLGAAAVFGGGIARADLCGLLTGGLMAIGLVADVRFEERRPMLAAARQASNAYWDWWASVGDVHCPGPMESHPTTEMFVRMSQRAAVQLEAAMEGMRVSGV